MEDRIEDRIEERNEYVLHVILCKQTKDVCWYTLISNKFAKNKHAPKRKMGAW